MIINHHVHETTTLRSDALSPAPSGSRHRTVPVVHAARRRAASAEDADPRRSRPGREFDEPRTAPRSSGERAHGAHDSVLRGSGRACRPLARAAIARAPDSLAAAAVAGDRTAGPSVIANRRGGRERRSRSSSAVPDALAAIRGWHLPTTYLGFVLSPDAVGNWTPHECGQNYCSPRRRHSAQLVEMINPAHPVHLCQDRSPELASPALHWISQGLHAAADVNRAPGSRVRRKSTAVRLLHDSSRESSAPRQASARER